jgi:hypothetical protein
MLVNKSSSKIKKNYKKAGRVISYALIMGACNLNIFNRCFVQFITSEQKFDEIEVNVEDIPDMELQNKIVSIWYCLFQSGLYSATILKKQLSDDSLSAIFDDVQIEQIVNMMNMNIPVKEENKKKIIKEICRFVVLEVVAFPLNEFKVCSNFDLILCLKQVLSIC